MRRSRRPLFPAALALLVALLAGPALGGKQPAAQPAPASNESDAPLDWLVPNESLKLPFREQIPIYFVSRGQNRSEWEKLPKYWNEGTEQVIDPFTREAVTRKVIRVKMPLGLNLLPPVPPENPMLLQKWVLGKRLYYDTVLSSNATVACATCHDPKTGFTDQTKFSKGINEQLGGMNAPTVINSAYVRLHFWDGRAVSLEDQAQGPVQNPIEMFAGEEGHAWPKAVQRIRGKGDYVKRFEEVFGTPPTRDAIAKAIATYERTVLSGNAIHDRAEVAARVRVEDEGGTDFTPKAADYATVLKQAFAAKDENALSALGLDATRDAVRVPEAAKRISNGRTLFFGKARCSLCHSGESFTDNLFHNLGVGTANGRVPKEALGRYVRQPLGHRNPEEIGAFKTPTLRALLSTKPYMHDGSEATLEAVVDFYDRGGNANEFLDPKMRDVDAELGYVLAQRAKQPWKGPEVKVLTRDGRPIVPMKLNLSPDEKKDLVLFLKALQGDPVDPVVADPKIIPKLNGK